MFRSTACIRFYVGGLKVDEEEQYALYVYICILEYAWGVKTLPRNKTNIVVSALAEQPAEPPAN
jgi:hypothetical protein